MTSFKGKVVDSEGNPLVGVKVVLPDSDKETYTDFDGAFQFDKVLSKEQKIQVNHISFEEFAASIAPTQLQQNELKIELFSK